MKINEGQASSMLIPEYIGSDFDKVTTVVDNIGYVKDVAESVEELSIVVVVVISVILYPEH